MDNNRPPKLEPIYNNNLIMNIPVIIEVTKTENIQCSQNRENKEKERGKTCDN